MGKKLNLSRVEMKKNLDLSFRKSVFKKILDCFHLVLMKFINVTY